MYYNIAMLYIVGTPIGNLEDLSYRQGKILASSKIILTEDTRTTGHLLKKIEDLFGFKKIQDQRLISYYKEKEFERLPMILKFLEDGLQVALISQAGDRKSTRLNSSHSQISYALFS